MERKPAPHTAPRRHHRSWILSLTLLAALTTVALVGCPTSTPVRVPEFSNPVGPLKFQVDTAIPEVELPFARGGSGKLTYSLGPELPPGLAFAPETRTLSGTPTTAGNYELIYTVRDRNGRSDELTFTVTIEQQTVIGSIVSEVTVEDSAAVLKFANVPEASGGPSVAVSGNVVVVAGGTVFFDVTPEPGAAVDKLLLSIGGEALGYYEVDVSGADAPYALRGQIRFDVDRAFEDGCILVTAVGADGTVGPATCHRIYHFAVEFAEVQITVSWDSEADLDLHVVDPTGEAAYWGRHETRSGGLLQVNSHCSPERNFIRNEHIGWARGTPPDGVYTVLLDHWWNCGTVKETNFVVSVYNHGQVSTFSGTITGRGARNGEPDSREITQFMAGDGPPPRTPRISSTYRGHGDQVFTLNADGETLDNTVYTLELGDASAEVYLIVTNTAYYESSPKARRLDRLSEVAESGRKATVDYDYAPPPRPALSRQTTRLDRITEFNNRPLPSNLSSATNGRLETQSRRGVAEGDQFVFHDRDDDGNLNDIPATARRVVTDGSITAAFWVADDDWGPGCAGAGPCVTEEMIDAFADEYLRPGAGNDVHDWVTTIFGAPWGPHSLSHLIPPEAADEIHVLLYDIDADGAPGLGECRVVGYFWAAHNFLQDPEREATRVSSERLIFFMDAPWYAIPSGPTWEATDRNPSGAISALAQELQHMIHFYQKPVLRDTISETWLNEMAGEMAQDLIADKQMVRGPRGVAHDDPTAGEPGNRRGRLPIYNLFNDHQVTTWEGKIANYSVNYAFGAYLARAYGGSELFSEIVQSDKAGFVAIEEALDALGHDVSFGEVLADWAVATLLSDNVAAPAPYRYNPGTWSTSNLGGQEFRLGSINLYNYRYEPPETVSDCIGPDLASRDAQEGPYLHSLQTLSERTQPPHSNVYATLGRNTGTVRLLLNAPNESFLTVVVKE